MGKKTLSEMISTQYGVEPHIIESLKCGESSVPFKDLVEGAFKALDLMRSDDLISDEDLITYKIGLFKMMVWSGKKLNELDVLSQTSFKSETE